MLLFNALTGMSENAAGTAEEVKKLLHSKYGQSFRVTHIGDRFNTGTTTLFCQPDDGSELSFTVVYKPLENTISDDLTVRKAAFSFDRELSEKLLGKGLASASITIFGEADGSAAGGWTSPAEFAGSSGTKYLFSNIALKGSSLTQQQLDDLLGVLADTDKECGGISFVSSVFLIPEEEYEACSKKLSAMPRITGNEIAKFSPAAKLGVTAEKGSAKITAGDISAAVKG